MTHTPFPTVAAYPLPAALATPPSAAPERSSADEAPHENSGNDRDALVQAVSDAIARRARQRRYTP